MPQESETGFWQSCAATSLTRVAGIEAMQLLGARWGSGQLSFGLVEAIWFLVALRRWLTASILASRPWTPPTCAVDL